MKKTFVLTLFLGFLLLLSGCDGGVTSSTTSPPTTSAPATNPPAGSAPTTAESSSSTTAIPPTTTTTNTSTTAGTVSTESTTYTAELSGEEVVPAVDTPATGTATFTIDGTGTRGHFVLEVSNITDVIAARVHEGGPDTNGRGLLILFPGPTQIGTFNGNLAGGNFAASALIGSLTGKTLADFVAIIESGQAYVNVGTVENPKGEIRGQIQ